MIMYLYSMPIYRSWYRNRKWFNVILCSAEFDVLFMYYFRKSLNLHFSIDCNQTYSGPISLRCISIYTCTLLQVLLKSAAVVVLLFSLTFVQCTTPIKGVLGFLFVSSVSTHVHISPQSISVLCYVERNMLFSN